MYADFIYPEYEVVRNYQRCIACRACERQCANEVHRYDADEQMMTADDAKCVNCHRCVSLCPTRALKIVRTDHTFKENANWTKENIQNVYRQAATGGVLLSSMGNPEPLPGYWDRILINASQVTRCANPWRRGFSWAKRIWRSGGMKTVPSYRKKRLISSWPCRSCSAP